MPVFHRGRLVGFSGSIAHLPDIGGSGWTCDTSAVFEEGLRLMPVRFIENGEENEIVAEIIRSNTGVGSVEALESVSPLLVRRKELAQDSRAGRGSAAAAWVRTWRSRCARIDRSGSR